MTRAKTEPDTAVARHETLDYRALVQRGDALERRQIYPNAWRCLADGSYLNARAKGRLPTQPPWDRRIVPGTRLLVLRLMRHIGAQLRMARVISELADKGMIVTLAVEPRLLDLFTRSFPNIRIIDESDIPDALERCDVWASYERVAQALWKSPENIAAKFRPLVPDPDRVSDLGRIYHFDGTRPVVGVSWYSSNNRKSLPSPGDWRHFFSAFACDALSLQYHPEEAGIADFALTAKPDLLDDRSIDPVQQLDAYAAQMSCVDIVVTISNTAAHMAGALGKRCVVLLDDGDHLIWSTEGRTPYYPSVATIRQDGCDWPGIFARAADLARHLLTDASDTFRTN